MASEAPGFYVLIFDALYGSWTLSYYLLLAV